MNIEKTELKKALDNLKRLLPKKRYDVGVQGIIIQGNKAIAYTNDIGMEAQLTATTKEPFVLNREAIRLLSKYPDGTLQIEYNDDTSIKISMGKIEAVIFNQDRYNLWDNLRTVETAECIIEMPGEQICSMIQSVLYAVADRNSTREVTQGVLFEAADGKLSLLAMDGYKAAHTEIDYAGDFKFIVKSTVLDLLLRLKEKGNVRIIRGGNRITIEAGIYKIESRVIYGDFPTHKDKLNEHPYSVLVNRKDLIRILESVLICNKMDYKIPVAMAIKGKQITLSGKSFLTRCTYTETIDIECSEDRELVIGVNPKNLCEALKNYKESSLKMTFGTPIQLITISNGKAISVVMPLRISN